jgi:hypothetical protein
VKRIALAVFLSLRLAAQTISAGSVYQAASSRGIAYVIPPAGIQILQQRAGLNYKSLLNDFGKKGSIGAIILGVTKSVAMGTPWLVGLSVFSAFWQSEGEPLLQMAAPNPEALMSNVLMMNQSLTATPQACGEGIIFASSIALPGAPAALTASNLKKRLKAGGAVSISVEIGGLTVSYTPQGSAVLVNSAGSQIKNFIVLDVLGCGNAPAVLKTGAEPEIDPLSLKIVQAHLAALEASEEEKIDPCAFGSCRELIEEALIHEPTQ